MTENINVIKPIEVKDNSAERVALDLMNKVGGFELGHGPNPNPEVRQSQKNREYWLNLYSDCLHVVKGGLHPSKD